MSERERSRLPMAVGVDLGGTWVRALAFGLDARRLRSFKGRAPDLASLPEFLRSLWRRWRAAPSEVAALVVATRGVWTASEARKQERRLQSLALKVRVLADVKAAYLGALGDTPGLLVLAGTGSIVLGRSVRGRWIRRGGLGPLLGDEGSAFWIGREWLKATSRGKGFEAVRRLVRSPDATTRIATAAVRAFEQARAGNRTAKRIVADAQRHLALEARDVARSLHLRPLITVSWAGRLLEDPWFRAGLWKALRRAGLALRPLPPREAPVLAAARLALTVSRRKPPARSSPRPPALPVFLA